MDLRSEILHHTEKSDQTASITEVHRPDGVDTFDRTGAKANSPIWDRVSASWMTQEKLGEGHDGKVMG